MKRAEKLLLIDGNAIVHRAFHALPPLTSPNGIVTNAVFGFTSILIKTIKEFKPTHIVATFDLAGPTFRHKEFEDYKVHRQKAPQELYDQIPLVKNIVRAFGIPVLEKEGFEADDLIGTVAQITSKTKNILTIIVSGDLDTLQLVKNETVQVFTMRKGLADTILYDEKQVIERFGLPPHKLVDFKGLKGDSSDNIPGVPGIGDKTASKLIQDFDSVEGLYKALENGKADLSQKLTENLLEHRDQAFFSKQLATIVTDVDIDFTVERARWEHHIDRTTLDNLFVEYGFKSLISRLNEINGSSEQAPETIAPHGTIRKLTSLADVKHLVEQCTTSKQLLLLAQDNELLLAPSATHVSRVTLSNKKVFSNQDFQLLFSSPTIKKITHNAKQVCKLLNDVGIKSFAGLIMDTHIAAYMLNRYSRSTDFASLTAAEFAGVTSSASDIERLETLAKQYTDDLSKTQMLEAFTNIELPLIPVLAHMEQLGIKADSRVLDDLSQLATKEIARLEKQIFKNAGREFNINSPKQLSEVLYDELGIKGKVRKTGGGARSTAAPELEKLRDENPIIDLILQYRELQKLKTTYIDPFPSWIGKDKRIHTTYNQAGTATGRISSQSPNLQNIPIRTELGRAFRRAFVADRGFELIAFDYSQIELRIAAHIAKDQTMIDAFKRGEDIHARTAAQILGVDATQVSPDQRRQAKVLNFGILYGMVVMGFARAAGVGRSEASDFIDRYFAKFSGIARYMEQTKQDVVKNGFVQTLFGHRRYLPEINSTMPQLRAQAERMAINMPIQGTQADLVKMAMTAIDKEITRSFDPNHVRMLLQVHDELIFEIHSDDRIQAVTMIKKIMETIYTLSVPLVVDVKSGKNWQDMRKLS